MTTQYCVRINDETVTQGQGRKMFETEQAAAEFAWADIKAGSYVYTFSDDYKRATQWKYEDGKIVGEPVEVGQAFNK